MDSERPNSSSSSIDSIRQAVVSRRGGVRVRGGRLPPIRMRDIGLSVNKKVIAPKIPQRRSKIKEETQVKTEQRDVKGQKEMYNARGRGRGRGTKVYLQTEGSFLGQGPALRVKKEQESRERGSIPRSFSKGEGRMKTNADVKIDANKIEVLLESYDEKEAHLDHGNSVKPVRLPLKKLEPKFHVKTEVIQTDDGPKFIKKEPSEDKEGMLSSLEGKFFTRIKEEEDSDIEECKLLKDIKHSKDKDLFILLQCPTCLPFGKGFDYPSKSGTTDKKLSQKKDTGNGESEAEFSGTSLKDVAEGYVGKLQVLRSGQMQLVLGSIVIALEDGSNSETLMQVVSLPSDRKDEGNIIILGEIVRKMILRPQLSQMMVSEEDICTKMNKLSSY